MDLTSLNVTDKICYPPYVSNGNGVWQGKNPLTSSLPLFVVQLTIIIMVTRGLLLVLTPLYQPRFVAETIGGMLLGSAIVTETFSSVFPPSSVMTIESMSSLSIVLYVFITGLQMDLSAVLLTGKKALCISVAGVLVPLAMGIGLFFLMPSQDETHPQGSERMSRSTTRNPMGCLFWGFSLSVTSSPIVARTLTELKLLHTELGRMTLSSAVINDICTWALLVLLLPVSTKPSTATYAVVSNVAFILLCVYVVRPVLVWIISRTTNEEGTYSDFYICTIVISAVIFGVITDACGTHVVIGAFMFGLIVPNGNLLRALILTLEDFVVGILLPLFFASCGVRIDISTLVTSNLHMFMLTVVMVIVLACTAKIVSTLFVYFYYNLPPREGVGVGVLMNTKGALSVLVLNIGRDKMLLTKEEYAVMVVALVLMMAVIGPIITTLYRPKRNLKQYKRRTIKGIKADSELRILACVHTPTNVPGMINLLAASNATKQSPIYVFGVHLVELTGRASAMLIVHNTRKSGSSTQNLVRGEESNTIITAFENFEHQNYAVLVQSLTSISPYATMHEDICNLAEDKRVQLILLPFHKQPKAEDGEDREQSTSLRTINQSVLTDSPCSVGIFVDRGLGSLPPNEFKRGLRRFAMLFIGGPDDREALTYAWRMGGNPGISVHVTRFVPGKDAENAEPIDIEGTRILEIERQRQTDDECINYFRLKSASNPSITYSEIVLNNAEETVAAIRAMDGNYDLFIVGKGQGEISPLTVGLSEWSDYPELGDIGDVLVSSSFASDVSVLVVQLFDSTDHEATGELLEFHDQELQHDGEYLGLRQPVGGNDGFELMSRHRDSSSSM